MAKGGYVYIITNANRTILYIGVTNNIKRRVYEHKYEVGSQFTHKYNLTDLMFYDFFESIEEAILNEKKFKNRHRAWKYKLLKKNNPNMEDLSKGWFDELDDLS